MKWSHHWKQWCLIVTNPPCFSPLWSFPKGSWSAPCLPAGSPVNGSTHFHLNTGPTHHAHTHTHAVKATFTLLVLVTCKRQEAVFVAREVARAKAEAKDALWLGEKCATLVFWRLIEHTHTHTQVILINSHVCDLWHIETNIRCSPVCWAPCAAPETTTKHVDVW